MSDLGTSLYSDYVNERLRHSLIVEPWGFIQYSINLPVCWIHEIYVRPEFRRADRASGLADKVAEIALNAGCVSLIAQVWTEALTATDALRAILAYGFVVTEASNNTIILAKKLGG